MPSSTSLRFQKALIKALIQLGALLAAVSFIAACSAGVPSPATSPTMVARQRLQLKTPLVPPTPDALVASYPMPQPFNPNEGLVGIALGSDGNIWASEFSGDAIARFTPAGVATNFSMPTANAGPTEVTAGPDGNLWCTEATANAIAQITTAGVITEFPLSPITFPSTGGGPRGIVAGPDGNLWFAHTDANLIGRMSTAGVIVATYAVPTPNSVPIRPAVGPDGNIWFTELLGNKIGRINITTGAIQEFVVPTFVSDPNGNPADITAGADGNMWFTERAASLIGRVTIAGVITEFTTPTPIARPQDITSTSDGSLWFAEYYKNGLARIDPLTLTIVEYTAPNSIGERAVTAGQGSATVWLTNEGSQAVDEWIPHVFRSQNLSVKNSRMRP
jgi:virginiamycin B lyase